MNNYYIRVKTEEQLKAVEKWGNADLLIIDAALIGKYSGDITKVIAVLPDIVRQGKIESIEKLYEACSKAGGIMIKNLDELGLLTEKGYEGRVIADSFLYTYNSEAAGFYLEYYPQMEFVCSDELTDREMLQTIEGTKKICSSKTQSMIEAGSGSDITDRFIYKIYGYQPLMITNQCVSRNYTSCSDKIMKLKDDRGNDFTVQSNCSQCYSILYNGSKTYMTDKLAEIPYRNLMVDLTIETASETEEVLREIEALRREGEKVSLADGLKSGMGQMSGSEGKSKITRGHHYKGVD